jgi:hypothetical protein
MHSQKKENHHIDIIQDLIRSTRFTLTKCVQFPNVFLATVFASLYIVTDDPGSKPDRMYAQPRGRQNYIRKS